MGIYLLSLSHKTTPLSVRSLFAYSEECMQMLLESLLSSDQIDEAAVLSTCNRMEIYCHGLEGEKEPARQIFEVMEREAVKAASVDMDVDLSRYMRRYHDRQAVHHLFLVAAGLDSMVIGEDQILGQVKQAHEFSHERGFCGTYLNTLFRHAVTGAKRVKTETALSKTPISTASLAVKTAEEKLGGLKNRKMMIIGATGRIGGIVLKNVQEISDLEIYVTTRSKTAMEKLEHGLRYQAVPYDERYLWLDKMDVVLSATTSPHYTLTAYEMKQHLSIGKKRVFLDLAVPPDIEFWEASEIWYYTIEDMRELARQNNERKQTEAATAERIIQEDENRFYKWLLYQTGQASMEEWKKGIIQDINEKGAERAINRLIYQIREAGNVEEMENFLSVLNKVNADREAAAKARPLPKKKKNGRNDDDSQTEETSGKYHTEEDGQGDQDG